MIEGWTMSYKKINKLEKPKMIFIIKNNSLFEGIMLNYNDSFLLKLKAKDIRVKRKKLNQELVELSKAEKNLNNLKRLKPREYKEISD